MYSFCIIFYFWCWTLLIVKNSQSDAPLEEHTFFFSSVSLCHVFFCKSTATNCFGLYSYKTQKHFQREQCYKIRWKIIWPLTPRHGQVYVLFGSAFCLCVVSSGWMQGYTGGQSRHLPPFKRALIHPPSSHLCALQSFCLLKHTLLLTVFWSVSLPVQFYEQAPDTCPDLALNLKFESLKTKQN